MTMTATERRVADVVAADHPSLPGHFPGQPIVPGVVLLDRVAAAARREFGALRIAGIAGVKFLRPLLPGQRFDIVIERSGEALLKFRCEVDAVPIAQGSLDLAR
jgi:3-hydroxymyristoyl/3-hydroxydecanoyl-(acyl carrier protein) dehydratase